MMSDVFTRLIVVDPSLRDRIGHALPYDRSLQDAATSSGLQAVVLAHRQVCEFLSPRADIVPTFSADVWGENRVPPVPTIRRLVGLHRLAHATFRPLVDRFVDRWLAERSNSEVTPPRSVAFLAMRGPAFYLECRRALDFHLRCRGDLVYCHMVTQRTLLEWALLTARLPPIDGCARLVLLLRYPLAFYKPERPQTRIGFRLLDTAARRGRVRLATDSSRLAEEYAAVLTTPLEVFPIPHTTSRPVRPRVSGETPLRIGYLGNPRLDKGFDALVDALTAVPWPVVRRPVRFVVQVAGPGRGCAGAVDRLRAARSATTDLVEDALAPEEYAALLDSLDVVLVLYRPCEYRSRTSGVFVEAVAAGKPVVVTDGTWMSDQLRKWGAGIVVSELSPAGIAAAIARAVEQIDALRDRAERTAVTCRAFHSPESLLRRLLAPVTAPVDRGRG